MLRAFMVAPLDDEPLTGDHAAAIREAEEEIARGEVVNWEEVRASLRPARKRDR
ncbi:MAG: hypothetical protein HY690_00290 [Chloroflexi bacterium]|nr:hypothetical protein [Chloroflexota bacterium]